MKLTVTVDRFEGDKAVLITADGKMIIWPREKLPTKTPEGAIFTISINDNDKQAGDERRIAKEILNEILNP